MRTMKYNPITVFNHNFTSQDKIFLDANIWLYLYGPPKLKSRWRPIYNTVFNDILKANSQIYIDALVVSEFINTYARLEWKLTSPHINQFKDFRNDPSFKPVAVNIAADVKLVLNHCSQVESGFTTLPMNSLLNDYATGDFDFNDQVITEICKSNGFTLITNDGDFKTQKIPVLTANQSLLSN